MAALGLESRFGYWSSVSLCFVGYRFPYVCLKRHCNTKASPRSSSLHSVNARGYFIAWRLRNNVRNNQFTSEVEATIPSQESQPPLIQRQVDQSTASEAVEINITEPFHLRISTFQKSIVVNRIAHFNPSGYRNFPGYTIMSKAILFCVSFACNKMQNQIFELPEVRKPALVMMIFQTR